ncbi:MAG: hypothetical protein JXA82_18065 [Sedimentisphaerales bacterium]|nr:hypothetical protein [Sedimentisphaerales bacterium]
MCRVFFHVGLVCVLFGLAVAELFSINPRATYLRTNQDTAYNTVPFALADLSLFPGDFIRLQQYGDYKPGTAGSHHDTSTNMIAVFSGSNILLSSDQLNRVQDANDAGIDYTTGVTYRGSLTTDIPEDFFVSDVYVQIPEGAAYLFIAAADSLYYDNSDPDGDYAVDITLCTCPIVDLNSDCLVNLSDFCILASQWQDIPADISADIYPQPEGDGFVDILDLAVLAENWIAAPSCE